MRMNGRIAAFAMALAGLVLIGPGASQLLAHCDALDGPVVKAAERALAANDVNLVLVWVQPKDEKAVRGAFADVQAVRKLGAAAQQLADRHFFETVVRLHRAGEGAAYTGLQPAGRDLGPAIPASDRAIESDDLSGLEQLLTKKLQEGLRERFEQLRAKRRYEPANLEAGRAYVASYVEFIHYAERLYEAAAQEAHGHYAEK